MPEEWVDMFGFEGLYKISNKGRVKSLRNNSVKLKYKNNILDGSLHSHGYKRVNLTDIHGNKKTKYVHRLVYESFNGRIEKPYEIDHIDGDKENNYLGNLQLVTHAENMIKLQGIMKRDWEELQDRILKEPSQDFHAIAKKYGINYITVFKIKKGLVNHIKNF